MTENPYIFVIASLGIFFLFCVLGLLCLPMLDFAVPTCLRKNQHIRRFFAWDCLETYEAKFDQTALKDFLRNREEKSLA